LGGFAIFFDFFACGSSGFGLEFLHATYFVYEALLTSEEGVATATDIDHHVIFGAACVKRGTARAGDGDLMVLWM
jgi:hypothetical protein